MASETSELTFVRCPSCRSLVPASAARCRICNNPLEGNAKADANDAARAPGRVRQKTITASAEELLQASEFGEENVSTENTQAHSFDGPPVDSNGGHDVVDPLADFLQDFDNEAPVVSAPPSSQEIPAAAAANDDDDDELDSFLNDFDNFTPVPEPVEEPVRQPMAPPVAATPVPEAYPERTVAAPVSPLDDTSDPLDGDHDPLEAFMTEADDDFDLDIPVEPVRESAPPVRQPEPERRVESLPRYEPEPVAQPRQERPQQTERRAAQPPKPAPSTPPPAKQARPAHEERGRPPRDPRHGGEQSGGADRREARKEHSKHERRSDEHRRENHQHRPRHEEKRHEERRPHREPTRSEAPVAGPKTGKMRPGRLFGWLVSFESPDGRSIELREGKFFITGSSIRGTDLVIEDPSISTPHALMSVSAEHGLLLQDLMSERGVFVRVDERGQYKREDGVVQLRHGEWVRFGDVEFLLTVVPGGDR